MLPYGSFALPVAVMWSEIRSVAPDVLKPLLWIGTRQAAQCQQPRHEADIGFRFARLDELIDLVETGEVVPRLGCGWRQGAAVGQLDRPGDIADRHESATVLLVVLAHQSSRSL